LPDGIAAKKCKNTTYDHGSNNTSASCKQVYIRTLEARADGFRLQVAGLHHVVVLAASLCSSDGMANGATNGQEEEDDADEN
jgi:hypothetical protein